MTKTLSFIAPLVLVAALAASASGSADPSVAPCAGVVATDPKGDETMSLAPIPVSLTGVTSTTGETPSLDIRSVYFTYRANAAGDEVLTGHLSVTDLSKDLVDGAIDNQTWWVEFADIEGTTSLKATSDGNTVKFSYGVPSDPRAADLRRHHRQVRRGPRRSDRDRASKGRRSQARGQAHRCLRHDDVQLLLD